MLSLREESSSPSKSFRGWKGFCWMRSTETEAWAASESERVSSPFRVLPNKASRPRPSRRFSIADTISLEVPEGSTRGGVDKRGRIVTPRERIEQWGFGIRDVLRGTGLAIHRTQLTAISGKVC